MVGGGGVGGSLQESSLSQISDRLSPLFKVMSPVCHVAWWGSSVKMKIKDISKT